MFQYMSSKITQSYYLTPSFDAIFFESDVMSGE